MTNTFKALILNKSGDNFSREVTEIDLAFLKEILGIQTHLISMIDMMISIKMEHQLKMKDGVNKPFKD